MSNFDNSKSSLEKIILAGIGVIAKTNEKSKELIAELIKKGELTVDQGKVMNEKLKYTITQAGHDIKATITNNNSCAPKEFQENTNIKTNNLEEVVSSISDFNDEELAKIAEKIQQIQNQNKTQEEIKSDLESNSNE